MSSPTVIPTDLITPLGVYIRLRGEGQAAFLLESVKQGRLGRHSFVGAARAWSRWKRRTDRTRHPSSATSPTTTSRDSSRPCRSRRTGRPIRRAVSSSPTRSSASTMPQALPRSSAATPTSCAHDSTHPRHRFRWARGTPGRHGVTRTVRTTSVPSEGEGAHPRRGRLPDRPLPARGAPHLRERDRALPDATPRQSLAVSLPARARRPGPDRLIAGDDRQGRGPAASLNPIAGTTQPGPGDAERLLASEKDRAEHVMLVDLGRNDLSRVCRHGTVHVERFMEPERFSHVTHLVSEVVGELREAVGPFDLLRACFPAGTVSGAPRSARCRCPGLRLAARARPRRRTGRGGSPRAPRSAASRGPSAPGDRAGREARAGGRTGARPRAARRRPRRRGA